MAKHKCFISFKTENIAYKLYIQNRLDIDYIDRSLDEPVESNNQDYIMRVIREQYLKDSTVTIHLIGKFSGENCIGQDQYYIKKELQASLYNDSGNTRNGILGIVLPEAYEDIYLRTDHCSICGGNHNILQIEGNSIKEFSENYFIKPKPGCAWSEKDRYCVLVKWDDFIKEPNNYIDEAYDKRKHPISNKVKVYPK